MKQLGSPKIKKNSQNSQYLVNNSFYCGLQPKRVSADIHLYMLLHKKVLRKAAIQKKYQENLCLLGHSSQPQKKGFKGKSTRLYHSTMIRTNQKIDRQFRIQKRATTCKLDLDEYPNNRLIQQRKVWIGNQNTSYRPNMMSNLTLYRRSFKNREYKQLSTCMNVVEKYKMLTSTCTIFESPDSKKRVKTQS